MRPLMLMGGGGNEGRGRKVSEREGGEREGRDDGMRERRRDGEGGVVTAIHDLLLFWRGRLAYSTYLCLLRLSRECACDSRLSHIIV